MPLPLYSLADKPPDSYYPPGIWQTHQTPLELLKFCTNPYNLLAAPELTNLHTSAAVVYPALSWSAPITLTKGQRPPQNADKPLRWSIGPRPPVTPPPVQVWTDGSAEDNGLPHCTAGLGWISSTGMEYSRRLVGLPLNNNVAEITTIITAISVYRHSELTIFSDSALAVKLCRGSLLDLES
jgi:RNase H